MPHLSAYCLTVETKTALAHQVKKGGVAMPGMRIKVPSSIG
jgi:coproporphyrinogen III oxidase-like Fe-S oxidoreductase